MTKITSFSSGNCKLLSSRVMKALKDAGLEEEYGIRISDKGGSYSDSNFTLKLECATLSEDGTVLTKEATDFKFYCHRYGLQESDLGRIFWDLNTSEQFKIIGCKPRSKKYPILVEKVSSGARYKFPANRVAQALAREDAA